MSTIQSRTTLTKAGFRTSKISPRSRGGSAASHRSIGVAAAGCLLFQLSSAQPVVSRPDRKHVTTQRSPIACICTADRRSHPCLRGSVVCEATSLTSAQLISAARQTSAAATRSHVSRPEQRLPSAVQLTFGACPRRTSGFVPARTPACDSCSAENGSQRVIWLCDGRRHQNKPC